MTLDMRQMQILAEGLELLGIERTERMLSRFSSFIGELFLWNRHTNLVGTETVDGIITRHILDSLSVYYLLKDQKGSILDIGAGAGFPSVPLKIADPSLSIAACERRRRRAAFLRNVTVLLGIDDMRVEERDVREVHGEFDIAVARGIGDLDHIVSLTHGHLKESAMIIAFKGKITEIEREMERLRESSGANERMHIDVQKVKVPYLDKEERNIVIIKTK
jgi:16S rRNA (guanine527-N7)-methyltransferase